MRIHSCLLLGAAITWTNSAFAAPPEAAASEEPPAEETRAPPGELTPAGPPRKDLPRVELHGGAYFWYYQPLSVTSEVSPEDSNIELYLASLDFEGRLDDFGLVLNPRFRDSEAREFFTSNVWIEEAYAFFQREYLTIKLGKLYSQASRLSDNTFYGNMPYFDGLKLDANYGVAFEGSKEWASGFGLAYYAQYFLLDGGTNGSLRDRDTVWVEDDVHRHHTSVVRLEPSFRINQKTSLRLGAAGSYTYVDFVKQPPEHVFRVVGDLSLAYGPLRVFGEFIAQFGKTAVNYPIPPKPAGATPAEPGRASGNNQYVIAGAEAQVWRLTGRYSFSLVTYRDEDVLETLHVPGIGIALHDNVTALIEYAYWLRKERGTSTILDNSLNGVIYARF